MRIITLVLAIMTGAASATAAAGHFTRVDGLSSIVRVYRDVEGIAHILARNEADMTFVQGWVEAGDRLFQMDTLRRRASGTLAELVGSSFLGNDVELRTIGLRRAAERSLAAVSEEARAGLEAYAAGVNAYVAAHPLPPEYRSLELTRFEPWTPLDSLVIGKLLAFRTSFELDIEPTLVLSAYSEAGAVAGFDGAALFFEDLRRSAPFFPYATISESEAAAETGVQFAAAVQSSASTNDAPSSVDAVDFKPATIALGKRYFTRASKVPLLRDALMSADAERGTNEWAVSGEFTVSGHALIANDPHLFLPAQSIFYPIHLRALRAGFDVMGGSFPGMPYIILGQNLYAAWGIAVNPIDATDVYSEQVVQDPTSPSGLSTVYLGRNEPIIPIPQVFRYNLVGNGVPDDSLIAPPGEEVAGVQVPPEVLIVPRRTDGPILELDLATGTALSLQYTGFSPTREMDALRDIDRARNLDDFIDALQFLDFGAQNFVYGDVRGNIAYFTSGEVPIREDLQAGVVNGAPPYLIRNGQGGNEWLPVMNPEPGQALDHEILPFDEMPKLINPVAGYFVNANNDPIGATFDNQPLNQLRPDGGIFYLERFYDVGLRSGQIAESLAQRLAAGPVSADDMKALQADVTLLDAKLLTPVLLSAFDAAQAADAHPTLAALGADAAVTEAVERLRAWRFRAPSGVAEGFDENDENGARNEPTAGEVASSIATTLYSVWRGQLVRNLIDAPLEAQGLPVPGSSEAMSALGALLDNFPAREGVGVSGFDFLPATHSDADRATKRDIVVLASMRGALDLLAGDAFAAAFGGSSDQDDYLWGRLHRLVLAHPLRGPFDIPPAGGVFPPSYADLDGVAVDGGYEAPDASTHSVRAADSNAFMFNSGPAMRYVGELAGVGRIKGQSSLPGGVSGVPGTPDYTNQFGPWLTNEAYPMRQRMRDLVRGIQSREVFIPKWRSRRSRF